MGFKPRTNSAQVNIYSKSVTKNQATHNAALAKVTYTMVGVSYRGLKLLRESCGLATDQKLVQHALANITWFTKLRSTGYSLVLRAPDGSTKVVPWADLLTNIRKTKDESAIATEARPKTG